MPVGHGGGSRSEVDVVDTDVEAGIPPLDGDAIGGTHVRDEMTMNAPQDRLRTVVDQHRPGHKVYDPRICRARGIRPGAEIEELTELCKVRRRLLARHRAAAPLTSDPMPHRLRTSPRPAAKRAVSSIRAGSEISATESRDNIGPGCRVSAQCVRRALNRDVDRARPRRSIGLRSRAHRVAFLASLNASPLLSQPVAVATLRFEGAAQRSDL